MDAYKKVYESDFEENSNSSLPVVEQLYMLFNMTRPKDFKGHSLSIADIIVVDGKQFFCDTYEFKEITVPVNTVEEEKSVYDKVNAILKEGNLYGEIETYPNGEVSVLIEWGDWKHEHAYLRYLMQKNGFTETGENVTEEDGSDCYSAIHTFKKVTGA